MAASSRQSPAVGPVGPWCLAAADRKLRRDKPSVFTCAWPRHATMMLCAASASANKPWFSRSAIAKPTISASCSATQPCALPRNDAATLAFVIPHSASCAILSRIFAHGCAHARYAGQVGLRGEAIADAAPDHHLASIIHFTGLSRDRLYPTCGRLDGLIVHGTDVTVPATAVLAESSAGRWHRK